MKRAPRARNVRDIPSTAIFRLEEAQRLLGLAAHTLRREYRLGRLKVSKRAGRLWTTGAWIHEWLIGGMVRRQPKAATAPLANGNGNGVLQRD